MPEPERKIHTALKEVEEVMLSKLREGGSVTFSPKGTSMLPMLHSGTDSVTLIKPPDKPRKGTVALFILKDEKGGRRYALHRLVRIKNDEYVFCGDNRISCDPPVKYEDILAVVSEFTRNGKKHGVKGFFYCVYKTFMLATVRIRPFTNRFERSVYSLWKRIFRKKTK